ncbi:EAL domain-containing protein [Magnetospirillum sp. UT-4]|uniref:EAL domain-containing protein n=1 Tax=Magnetospirillum sp. UT-4 TaxID=2681467 RepID=UPI0013818687|nr:EAL domain-containing protein [Magnetospirillum sp. UT-4]CAA7614678.1 Signal transduction protein [Magnetospirillum sp. UT-4]
MGNTKAPAKQSRTENRGAADEGSAKERLGRSQEAYVAFAFAAADLLLEIDDHGRIVFAVGASMALVGRPARLLADTPLIDLVRPDDRKRLAKALKRMAGGARVRHTLLTIDFPSGDSVPVALSGYPHPDRNGRLLCVLTHSGGLVAPPDKHGDTGLLDGDGLSAAAEQLLREGDEGDYRLTLLDLPEMQTLRERLGAARTAEFVQEFSDYLRRTAVDDAAAEVGEHKFGLIHSAAITSEDIAAAVAGIVDAVAGEPVPVVSSVHTITLDTAGMSSQEAARALAYTIRRFAADDEQTIEAIVDGAKPSLAETMAQMRAVKQAIECGDFQLLAQPIVDLWTNSVHHFECLLRFRDGGSPYDTVTFAENLGLVADLDMAVCLRAVDLMRSGAGANPSLKFAVNVSGRTLASPMAAARIVRLVESVPDLRGRLLFEITESSEIPDLAAANAVIQEIRSYGHPVGVDDFGAGAAAFHYLRALKVDHVKIDGSYVRDMTTNDKNGPFLRAITQLCRELRVATIAEQIEDEETANLLRVYNVRYGQGYYFGRPMQPLEGFDPVAAWAAGDIVVRNGLLFFGAKGEGGSEEQGG